MRASNISCGYWGLPPPPGEEFAAAVPKDRALSAKNTVGSWVSRYVPTVRYHTYLSANELRISNILNRRVNLTFKLFIGFSFHKTSTKDYNYTTKK